MLFDFDALKDTDLCVPVVAYTDANSAGACTKAPDNAGKLSELPQILPVMLGPNITGNIGAVVGWDSLEQVNGCFSSGARVFYTNAGQGITAKNARFNASW